MRLKRLQDQDGDGRAAKRWVSWHSVREEALKRRDTNCMYVPERSRKTQGGKRPSENNRELQEFSLRVWRVRASAAVAEARVQFPAPTWWFTTIQNPDSKRSGTLF